MYKNILIYNINPFSICDFELKRKAKHNKTYHHVDNRTLSKIKWIFIFDHKPSVSIRKF